MKTQISETSPKAWGGYAAALGVLLLAGCEGPPPTRAITTDDSYHLHVVRIDGCQYLESGAPNMNCYSLTHKGNCDNPIHKHAQ